MTSRSRPHKNPRVLEKWLAKKEREFQSLQIDAIRQWGAVPRKPDSYAGAATSSAMSRKSYVTDCSECGSTFSTWAFFVEGISESDSPDGAGFNGVTTIMEYSETSCVWLRDELSGPSPYRYATLRLETDYYSPGLRMWVLEINIADGLGILSFTALPANWNCESTNAMSFDPDHSQFYGTDTIPESITVRGSTSFGR